MSMRMKNLTVMVQYAVGVGLAASLASLPAMAQQAEKVEKIEVTGSSIKRIEGEAAVPITVIKREDIQKAGVTTASDLLDRIASNTGGYNLSAGVGDSGKPGFAGASLRGLGSSNTLILLNGRRLANHAFDGGAVDINSIPLAAIERVEILKDGASAIYGTDAIGGVINFILRKDFTGAEASVYASATEKGGADTNKITLAGGFGDLSKDRFNILGTFDYEEATALPARLRKFASTGIRPDLGFTKTSGNTDPANIGWTGGPGNINPSAATGCVPGTFSYQINATTGAPAPKQRTCREDFTAFLDIYPPTERQSYVGRGVFQLAQDHQLFGEMEWVKNKISFGSSPTPVNDFSGNGNFIYPAGGKYYPKPFVDPSTGATVTPTGNLILRWRADAAGLRTNEPTSYTSRFIGGAKGSIFGNWDYEAAANYSLNRARDTYTDGWLSEKKLKAAMLTGLINPFAGGQDAVGQALLNSAKILEDVRQSKGSTKAVDAKVSGELLQLPSGPLALALGAERRIEKLGDHPLAILSSGDVQGGGGALQPIDASRGINAAFLEFNIPIVKGLEAQLAVRHDKYSDFGSTTNPKVALRWNPIKPLLLRGSYNTGFHAPTLPDLFTPQFRGNIAGAQSDPVRCPDPNATSFPAYVNSSLECDAQFNSRLGGNKDLKPEKSKQWTFGIVVEPAPFATVGLDFWGIERKDSIGALGDATLFGKNFAKYDGTLIHRGTRLANGSCTTDDQGDPTSWTPAGVVCAIDLVDQFAQNLGLTKTTGLDVNINMRLPKNDIGQFRVGLDGTYVKKYDYQREVGGDFINNVGEFQDGSAIPRWRHALTFGFDRSYWNLTLINNYNSGYLDEDGVHRVSSYQTWDVQSGWTPVKGMKLALGVKNALDKDPPASVQGQSFQVGYDPKVADPRGRMFYGSVSYKF